MHRKQRRWPPSAGVRYPTTSSSEHPLPIGAGRPGRWEQRAVAMVEDDPRITLAIIIAQHVRNMLEPLHGDGEQFAFLSDDEMKRINIAVRYAIFGSGSV